VALNGAQLALQVKFHRTFTVHPTMKLPTVTQAFLLHFAASLAVFCALVALMVFYWFPGPLFFMEGGWDGLKIIAPIDLVLGPALTLAFYRPWKKNVRFDMAVIVAVQVAALSYGVYAAYGQRTAAIVYAGNRFETVSYTEFKAAQKVNEELGRPSKSVAELGGRMPVLAYVQPLPQDKYMAYLEELLNGGIELRERSDLYLPISKLELDSIRSAIAESNTVGEGEVVEFPASSKDSASTLGNEISVPLKARFNSGELTINTETWEIVRISANP
jgi:hypothetical protein